MVNLSLQLKPELKQLLALILSPHMLQMLNVLQMPYVDLLKKIDEESENNVLLEVEKKDELIEYLKYASREGGIRKAAFETEGPDINSLGDKHLDLYGYLEKQLDLEKLSEKEKMIGEYLIRSIDKRGYLIEFSKVKAEIEKNLEVSSFLINKVLKIVQTFEPEGVGGRDLKECLAIQIHEHNFENEELKDLLEKVVSKYLDDLAEKKFEKIAGALNIPVEGVKSIADFIKNNLNPDPGSKFSKKSEVVIPSFAVEEKDGKLCAVNLEETYGPVIKLNPQYLKLLEDPKSDAKTVEFLKAKLENAKQLLESIHKRHETSKKILDLIVTTQTDFLKKGPLWLKPLMQKNIAARVEVHPSTISRAIAGKYIETPKGTFSLKYLCPRLSKGSTPERIKALIADIIREKNGEKLSDDKIKELLKTQSIEIKRRTIAAYRKELGIPSSFKRIKNEKK